MELEVFADLAEAMGADSSVSVLNIQGKLHVSQLNHLMSVGAIEAWEDEFGETRFALQPAGVRPLRDQRVTNIVFELRAADVNIDTKAILKLDKLQAMITLFANGHRPVNGIAGALRKHTSEADKLVDMDRWNKSALYFKALLMSPSLFERGLQYLHHRGSHQYYKCLMTVASFEQVNGILDASITSDETWACLMSGAHPLVLGLEMPDDDEAIAIVVEDVAVPLAGLPPVAWELACLNP